MAFRRHRAVFVTTVMVLSLWQAPTLAEPTTSTVQDASSSSSALMDDASPSPPKEALQERGSIGKPISHPKPRPYPPRTAGPRSKPPSLPPHIQPRPPLHGSNYPRYWHPGHGPSPYSPIPQYIGTNQPYVRTSTPTREPLWSPDPSSARPPQQPQNTPTPSPSRSHDPLQIEIPGTESVSPVTSIPPTPPATSAPPTTPIVPPQSITPLPQLVIPSSQLDAATTQIESAAPTTETPSSSSSLTPTTEEPPTTIEASPLPSPSSATPAWTPLRTHVPFNGLSSNAPAFDWSSSQRFVVLLSALTALMAL